MEQCVSYWNNHAFTLQMICYLWVPHLLKNKRKRKNKAHSVLVTVRSVRSVLSIFRNPRQRMLNCLLCWLDRKNVESIEARSKMASLRQHYQQLFFGLK